MAKVTPYESTESGVKESLELNGQFNTTLFSPDLFREIEATVDNVERLLGTITNPSNLISNIQTLESKNINKVENLEVGWNYFSMPVASGGSAARLSSKEFLDADSWEEKFEIVTKNNPDKMISLKRQNELSPLEKYELLIGVKDFKLSKNEWAKGSYYIDRNLPIPYWFGACHGTAPAAVQEDEPVRNVVLISKVTKVPIEFTPADIKALLAYAWANNSGASETIGQRCNFPIGSQEYQNSSTCFDTNPGSFHMAILNIIGLERYPLLIDTSGGSEVWNRPILGYEISYFNPNTNRFTANIKDSIVSRDKLINDKYSATRAKKTKYVVGAWARLNLLNDTSFGSDQTELKIGTMEYRYDLELDKDFNIIGGEWREDKRPDFIWIASPQAKPMTTADYLYEGSSDGRGETMSNELNQIAKLAYDHGSVSYRVLNFINTQSN